MTCSEISIESMSG